MKYTLMESGDYLVICKGKVPLHRVKKSDIEHTHKKNMKDIDKFIVQYKKQRKKFYGTSTSLSEINKNSQAYSYLRKACEMAKAHGVSAKKYIKAQVKGLEFTEKFPSPLQLTTDGAEQRLLEYVQKENVRNQKLPFRDYDRNTPLRENKRYAEIAEKYKKGKATYYEAMYLLKCQKARKGRAGEKLREYVRAKKDRKDSKKTSG